MSSSLRFNFEKDIRDKLIQKASTFQSEEGVLQKCFRFFDLDNSGTVSFDEFVKAIEKIGVQVVQRSHFRELFDMYDTDGDGVLDYREFASIVFNNASPSTRQHSPPRDKYKNTTAQSLLDKVRATLVKRGPGGILSLGKQFTITDRNNSRSLDREEFIIALRNFGTGLNETEAELLFDYFDRDRSGAINYDEFVYNLSGEMNSFRRKLVEQAFNKLDKDHSGHLTIDDLRGVYNPSNHPDVKAGKKTENQVLTDFLKTFENVYDFNRIDDDQVTKDEFIQYYNFISASIDSDKYFEALINNSWKIGEGANRRTGEKGWTSQYDAPRGAGTSGGLIKPVSAQGSRKTSDNERQPRFEERAKRSAAPSYSQQTVDSAINLVRSKLNQRGARGFIGVQRQFKIMDDDNDKAISYPEFTKAMRDFKINLTEEESRALFSEFDADGSGKVSIDEFIRGVRGEMNDFRKKLVKQAFSALDRDNDGVLRVNDIKGVYSARNHPDVRSGRRTENDILGEFLETFEAHHNLKKGARDQNVTLEEFMEYYNNISANIDDDKYFEHMITTGYKLGQSATESRPAWGQSYKGGKGLTTPWGVTEAPTDYSTSQRPQTAQERPKSSYAQEGTYQSTRGQSQQQGRDEDSVVEAFRDRIASRGTRGIIGLARLFKIADDNNSGTLDLAEFTKVLKDLRLEFGQEDVKRLFARFDRDRSGTIDYDEFLRQVRGPMNQNRIKWVKEAFAKLDSDRSGIIDLTDVRGRYNVKNHPDVRAGKKTEDEVLVDFLDTFEQHHAVATGDFKMRDSRITFEEFCEYYSNVSASIDDDRYFETMIRNAWKLDNTSYDKSWRGEYQNKY